MRNTSGFVLVLTPDRHELLPTFPDEQAQFSEPVAEFAYSRSRPLVCFVIDSDSNITHIARGKRGPRAGTALRRLNLKEILQLRPAIGCASVIERVSTRLRATLANRLSQGGLLPPKTFQALIQSLSALAPDTSKALVQYSEERAERIRKLPAPILASLAEQKDAVATALTIAGFDKENLAGWDTAVGRDTTSYLDGLPQVRLREDPMINNDLSIFPGHEMVKKTIHNSVVFENNQSKLTVVLANRLPLEEQTGADLIYYNETFKCFLMIQYKAMEHEGQEAVFRFPNTQLNQEIKRMDLLLQELRKCVGNDTADGYRLCENPFFLKLCPRITFDPDNVALVKGMYLPLDYWHLISEHPCVIGPRGGKQLSYRNVRRYFDNSAFVNIAAGGWVGTTINQSSVLESAIRATLESGKAAVVAINEQLDSRHRMNTATPHHLDTPEE
jgi:hypothetical protein